VHHPGRNPVFDPKPAYEAARTLTQQLEGFKFVRRLRLGGEKDFLLLFKNGTEEQLVAWTRNRKPHHLSVPASPGLIQTIAYRGDHSAPRPVTGSGFDLELNEGPQYIRHEGPDQGFGEGIPDYFDDSISIGPYWRRGRH